MHDIVRKNLHQPNGLSPTNLVQRLLTECPEPSLPDTWYFNETEGAPDGKFSLNH